MNKIVFIFISIAFFFGCKKKTTPASEVDLGQGYYPTTVGKFVVYDVDSIIYDEFTFDSTHYKYRIKEKIEEEFTDNENKKAYKLARYIKKFSATKPFDSIAWSIKDVWQVNVNPTNVEVVEENVRFTKLIFPVKTGSKWNGNAKNTMGEWEYTYSLVDATESVNSLLFEKVATVTQKDFRTLISWQYYMEKYAKGTGLVYREIIDIKHAFAPLTTLFYNIPQKQGVYYKLNVITYGNE